MKATDDLKKAGITGPHAEAISSTLHRVVDNQAATKEELEKTNEALAAQGKDLAALKTAQEAQGEALEKTNEALAAQGKDLAALKTAQEAQGKEQVAQGKDLAVLKTGQEAQGKDLAALKAGQEKAATKEEVKYLGITLRWAFGILTSAVLLICFQLYQFQSDVIKVLLANTVNISASKEIPATMGANDGTLDAGEKPTVAGADEAPELVAGAAEKPVVMMPTPPASETNGAAEPDAGERPAVARADDASELEAGAAEKPVAAANSAAGLDAAEAESPAGAATAVAVQR